LVGRRRASTKLQIQIAAATRARTRMVISGG
jgi:hypothetical protein